MSVGAVILAAGSSRRLGRAKQDVVLGGETLLRRAGQVALQAGLSPVIAVVREPAWAVELELLGVRVVVNPGADEGMASSVRCGMASLEAEAVKGVVLLTCDQPLLRPEHLRALTERPGCVTGSGYAGRVGVPAYFPATVFPQLLSLTGDVGARDLLRGAAAIDDEDLRLDVDTEEDLQRALRRFEAKNVHRA